MEGIEGGGGVGWIANLGSLVQAKDLGSGNMYVYEREKTKSQEGYNQRFPTRDS